MPENPFSNFTAHRLENPDTKQDYVLFKFPRSGQREHGTLLDRPSVFHRPHDLKGRLVDAGAELPPNILSRDLAEYLLAAMPPEVGLLTSTTGWKQDVKGWVFLLPNRMIGKPAGPMVLEPSEHCLATGSAGTLEGWRKNVALPARDSIQAGAAILAAFAAPLLNFAELPEAFVLNWFGNSSSGKTTANRAAASVWGNPTRSASWNASDRGLEEIAAANCDLPLILDDAEQGTKDSDKRMGKLNAASHLIASGIGKSYSKTVTDQLGNVKFRCLGLSSSPVSVESSVSRTDGDRVRFLEVAVAHGDDGGIWAKLGPTGSAAASEALTNAANSNYGFAGVAWAEFLVGQQVNLKDRVAKHSMKCMKKLNATGSVERRIAKKCALLYAAGRMAIKAKLLPWTKSDLDRLVSDVLDSALQSAFSAKFDVHRAVSSLAISITDKRKFPHFTSKELHSVERKNEVSGYRLSDKKQVLIELAAFKRALAQDFDVGRLTPKDYADVVDLLQTGKVLLPGHGEGLTRDVRFGVSKRKMIVMDVVKLKALAALHNEGQTNNIASSKPLRT